MQVYHDLLLNWNIIDVVYYDDVCFNCFYYDSTNVSMIFQGLCFLCFSRPQDKFYFED